MAKKPVSEHKPRSGRPTKYRSHMPDLIIKYGKRGLSRTAICAKLDIANETSYQWTNKKSPVYNKEFAEALQASKAYSLLYFEELIQDHVINQDGNLNNAAVGLFMRNVHGWDSKQTVEHTGAEGKALTFNFNLVEPVLTATEILPKQITDEENKDD